MRDFIIIAVLLLSAFVADHLWLGRNYREGMKHKRACGYRKYVDLETLVCTRGRDFPIARIAERLRCPACGCRQVSVMFSPPKTPQINAAAARPYRDVSSQMPVTSDRPKVSAYIEAGAPTECFLPACHKHFDGTAVHGKTATTTVRWNAPTSAARSTSRG